MRHSHTQQKKGSFSVLAGLTPYTGPWGKSEVLHLLRRTTFGTRRADVNTLLSLDLDASLDLLFTPEPTPAPPVNEYQEERADPEVPLGQTWVNAAWVGDDGAVDWLRMRTLKNWWSQQIYDQSLSIHQKLIFFLQSFVTNNYGDSGNPQLCYGHFTLFFSSAFGSYKEFIKQYTVLPLTLQYLNGNVNRVGSPDENYARELQELFTIGKGPNSNYTEQDVREAARVLTGWTYPWPLNQTQFLAFNHDTGDKQFSSFYGNRLISGKSGQAGRDELDDLLDMIFTNEECALYLARRIYTFFVFPEISEAIEQDIITPLADLIRTNDYQLAVAIRTLLGSEHFFEQRNRGVIIKSPVDFILGTFRTCEVKYPNNYQSLYEKFQTETGPIWLMSEMGINLGDAPSVAGWPAYYQVPTFDRNWATANTIAVRALRTDSLVYWGFWTPGKLLNVNVLEFAATFEHTAYPNLFVEEVLEFLLGYYDPSPVLLEDLKNILLSGQANDAYWTNAWETFLADPANETYKGLVEWRLQALFQKVFQLPEYHLH
ncbi:MAG: DUF1800 family protein [Bacteroidota bacterium]